MPERPPIARVASRVTGRGLVLFRLFGIEVAVHASWLVIFGLMAVFARGDLAPHLAPSAGSAALWAIAAGLSIAFAACILVHELAHAVVARMEGLDAQRVTLFLLGGVASIGSAAPRPAVEFRIAVAGPMTSLLLASILALAARMQAPDPSGLPGILGFYALVNLVLGLFNLVPGFPLDGGRILRSALWAGMADHRRATRVAAMGGRLVGLIVIGMGLATLVMPGEGNAAVSFVWYVMLGWFLFGAAGASERAESPAAPADEARPAR